MMQDSPVKESAGAKAKLKNASISAKKLLDTAHVLWPVELITDLQKLTFIGATLKAGDYWDTSFDLPQTFDVSAFVTDMKKKLGVKIMAPVDGKIKNVQQKAVQLFTVGELPG